MVCGFDPQKDNRQEIDGDCKQIARLMDVSGSKLDHIDVYGMNAVAIGASRGLTKFCKFLIEQDVPFDLPEPDFHTTPLMRAASNGYTDTFDLLLNKGANITALDSSGLTAMHHAVIYAMRNKSISSMEKVVESVSTIKPDLLNQVSFL